MNEEIHPTLTLVKLAEQHNINEITFEKGGEQITARTTATGEWKTVGDSAYVTKAQLQEGLTTALKRDKPEVLMSELEKHFNDEGWQLIYTPPYSPQFQPVSGKGQLL